MTFGLVGVIIKSMVYQQLQFWKSCNCARYPKHLITLKQTLMSSIVKNPGQLRTRLEIPMVVSEVIDCLFRFAFQAIWSHVGEIDLC